MATQDQPIAAQNVILTARQAQRMTMREFAVELSVSHNSVNQWENGIAEPTEDRIRAWLIDPRPWVKQLGFNLFMARHGDTLAAMSAAVQNTESKAA